MILMYNDILCVLLTYIFQFIYNRGTPGNNNVEEGFGLARASVDCVQEEEEEDPALHQMCRSAL